VLAPILRYEPDPRAHRRGRRARAQRFSAQPNGACVVAIDPEDRAGDLAATRADQSRQSGHLAGSDLERDVGEDAFAGQAVNLENSAGRRVCLVLPSPQLSTHHAPNQIVGRQSLEPLGPHELPIPEDGDALAQRKYLLQAV